MDDKKGYQVFRRVSDDPGSREGEEIIKKLLIGGSVKSFPFSISKGVSRPPDYHTVDCVVFVENGDLIIGFGDQYKDQVEVKRGDYLFIKKDTPHLECAGVDRDVELKVYYTGEFQAGGVS